MATRKNAHKVGDFSCQDCRLYFETSDALERHRKKFCIGSEIGDPTTVLQRVHGGSAPATGNFQHENYREELSVAEVKEYLRGAGHLTDKDAGRVSLALLQKQRQEENELIRKQVEGRLDEQRALQTEALYSQIEASESKARELDTNLVGMVRELQEHKVQEMKSKMEYQRAVQELRDIKTHELVHLDQAKQRELEYINDQLEAFADEERRMQDEIERARDRVRLREEEFERERRIKLQNRRGLANNPVTEQLQQQASDVAEKHTRAMADIQDERQRLMEEKKRVTTPSRKGKEYWSGGQGRYQGNYTSNELVKDVTRHLDKDNRTLDELRASHAQTVRELQQTGQGAGNTRQFDDSLDISQPVVPRGNSRLLDDLDQSGDSRALKPNLRAPAGPLRRLDSPERTGAPRPLSASSDIAGIRPIRKVTSPLRLRRPSSATDMPVAKVRRADLEAEIRELKKVGRETSFRDPQIKAEFQQDAAVDRIKTTPKKQGFANQYGTQKVLGNIPGPGAYGQDQGPGLMNGHQRDPSAAMLVHNPTGLTMGAGGSGSYQPGGANPMAAGGAGTVANYHQQQVLENQRLQYELQRIQAERETNQLSEQRQAIQQSLQMLNMRLYGMATGAGAGMPPGGMGLGVGMGMGMGGSAPGMAMAMSMGQDPTLLQLQAQELEVNKTIASLPPGHEMLPMYQQHAAEMAKMRLETEKMLREAQLAKLKADAERQKLEAQAQLEDHRRALARQQENQDARERKHLAMQLAHSNPEIGEYSPSDYDPAGGFAVYWDYIDGIPEYATRVQFVYGFFEGDQQRNGIKAVPAVEVDATPDLNHAIFALKRHFRKVKPSSTLRLLIEAQQVTVGPDGADSGTVSLGWTVFEPFSSHGHLHAGFHRIPMYRTPVDPTISRSGISQLSRVGNLELYIRICPHLDLHFHDSFGVHPTLVQPFYSVPTVHTRSPTKGNRKSKSKRHQQAEAKRVHTSHGHKSHTRGGSSKIPKDTGRSNPSRSLRRLQSNIDGDSESEEDMRQSSRRSQVKPAEIPEFAGDITTMRHFETSVAGIHLSNIALNMDLATETRVIVQMYHAGDPVLLLDGRPMMWMSEPVTRSFDSIDCHNQLHIFEGFPESTETQFVIGVYAKGSKLEAPKAWGTVAPFRDGNPLIIDAREHEVQMRPGPIAFPPTTDLIAGSSLKCTVFVPDNPPHVVNEAIEQNSAVVPYIRNIVGFVQSAPFKSHDGIDLYIDGARFLPANVTASQVVIRLVAEDGSLLAGPDRVTSSVTGATSSPAYDGRFEYRLTSWNPRAVFFIQIFGLDEETGKACLVGYSVISAFTAATGPSQPNSNEDNFCLRQGAFQLPIHVGVLDNSVRYSDQLLDNFSRVPCATLLVRVVRAPKAEDGIKNLRKSDIPEASWVPSGVVQPNPGYETGVYDSSRCIPLPNEEDLYEIKAGFGDRPIRDGIRTLDPSKASLPARALQDWIAEQFETRGPENEFLDFAYAVQYNEQAGFSVRIASARNLPKVAMYKALFGLTIPGSYFTDPTQNRDVYFTRLHDLDQRAKNPVWMDSPQSFEHIESNPHNAVLVHVYELQMKKKVYSPVLVGWAVLPIFSKDGFVGTGRYRLPLWKPPIPEHFYQDFRMDRADNVIQYALKEKRIKPLEWASITVELADAQLGHSFAVFPPLDVSFLSRTRLAQYDKEGDGKTLRLVIGKGDVHDIVHKANAGFMQAKGLEG